MNYTPHWHLDRLTFIEKSIIHHQMTEGNIEYVFWEQISKELAATYAMEQAYGDPEKIAALPKHFNYVMVPDNEVESDKYGANLSTASSLVQYMVVAHASRTNEILDRMPYRRLSTPVVEEAVIPETKTRHNWFQRIFA